jgi:hypothetical protein
MDPFRELGRMLFVLGALLVSAGALLYFGGKLPFRLGRLPGDVIHRGEHTTFYFPIVTCLVLSAAFSLLLWLFGYLRNNGFFFYFPNFLYLISARRTPPE